jgi:spore maturation protein CgeB
MKILRIAMDGEEYPNYTLTNAFKNVFSEVKTIWWQQISDVNATIINEVTNGGYDAVFLQIQSPNVINEAAAKAIYEHSLGFNWTGDVRTNIDWYIRLGKYFVTCFTNMTDVLKMRQLGLRAEYLQIGYDDKYYFPQESECHNNIVFCANYYPNNDFPLTSYRKDIVYALKREFGDKFNLYGANWRGCGISAEVEQVNNSQEAHIYRTAAIAINCSHFDYSRYSSDRLLREMASGAFVLSHNFKDIDKDFNNREHLVTWDNISDLIEKCHYYLKNCDERKQIAAIGCQYVKNTATWKERMMDFKDLIYKHKNL